MIIRKAFKYRLYPTEEQKEELNRQFGSARFVYNRYLNVRKTLYEQRLVSLSNQSKQSFNYVACANDLTTFKKSEGFEWLKEADSQVLQQVLKDLETAYQNFFEGKAAYPNFKKKHDKQSIRYPQRFKLVGGRIYLPKVGWVEIIRHRRMEGTAKNATVSKTKTGKYFVSIQCEVEVTQSTPLPSSVGIDLGLKHFAILSTGEKIDNPKHLRTSQRRLKIRQRRLSRKCKRSNGRAKQRQRVASIHEKVANQRRDFHHKLSRRIVDEFGKIGLEDLNIKGMVKNHHLAKSISDVGWGQFVQFVTYKAEWMNGEVITHDRFFASSKTCNDCGAIHKALTLSDRTWVCVSCGSTHDRDTNAAKNLNPSNKLPKELRKVTPVEIRAKLVKNSAPEKSQHVQLLLFAVEAQRL